MLELYSRVDCAFTDAEKEECIPVLCRIVELAQIVRKHGLLAVGDVEIAKEQNFFLKHGLQLAFDATHPDIIREILQTIILSDAREGAELLSRMIIAQGIVSLALGETPHLIAYRLTGMLGEEHSKKAADYAEKACLRAENWG